MDKDNLEEIELELFFKFNISVTFSFLQSYETKCKKVLCQSNNQKFIAFKYQEVLYIIENQLKPIFRVESKISNCCFSEDSKYSAIFLHNYKQKLLILFDLQEEKIVFTKKINFLSQLHIGHKLNFYQNSIIMTSLLTIEVYSMQGEEKFQLQRYPEYSNTQIKLNEKFLILSSSYRKPEVNQKKDIIILSAQSFRMQKIMIATDSYARLFIFSENLLFHMPSSTHYFLILREILTNKIIRKYKNPSQNSVHLFLKEQKDKEIIGYTENSYYKIDVSEGNTKVYPKVVKDDMLVKLFKSNYVSTLITVIKEKKVWKKDHSKQPVQLQFYKIKDSFCQQEFQLKYHLNHLQ